MTTIEWTDKSVNPIRARLSESVGHHCVKVSAGCKHCYASRLQPRFGMPTYDKVQERRLVEHFLELDASKLDQVLRRQKPTRWFWCSMTDLFGEWVPFRWIAACLGVMAATPKHTHQLVTKRPERALAFFEWLGQQVAPDGPQHAAVCGIEAANACADVDYLGLPDTWPLPNVQLGVSVENQAAADERVPRLLQCPAAVWWISAEPLLGPLDLNGMSRTPGAAADEITAEDDDLGPPLGGVDGISWVVVGGESGPGARPCDASWIRSINEQCREADVPCYNKQLGSQPTDRAGITDWHPNDPRPLRHPKGGDMSEWPEDLRIREFPSG